MNNWVNRIAIVTAMFAIMGLFALVVNYKNKADWCYANGGKMVDTATGYVCAKLEVLK
jgi:high-affinity Fe2+/Pb2+ permease